jgi:hypothetical protein
MGVDNDKNINEKESLTEGQGFTEFPGANVYGSTPALSGKFAAFFKSFFTGKKKRGRPQMQQPLAGDVIKSAETLDNNIAGGSIGITKGAPSLPQIEYERRKRYNNYDKMDEYPEIGASIDIYSDDATQKTLDGDILTLETEEDAVSNALNDFIKTTELNKYLWDIVRNVVKYGDCFVENIVDLNNSDAGIQRIKILNPLYIFREEDRFGYLKGFIQEVPKNSNIQQTEYSPVGKWDKQSVIKLDREQLVHFRGHTSDANYYPYGKSILAPGVRAWKSLRMMEDAMLIYRLHRAPERRIFYIETGNLPQTKVEMFMERVKAKFKKEKFFNTHSGSVDERFNPLSADEDFFVPIQNGKGTKIETLPGAQNLGEIDDVRYFRDKVLAAMKVPKDFVVEKDKSPERKANLSQLDAKFAKAVLRVQRDVEVGLKTLFQRHLKLRGFPTASIKGLEVKLAPPSDIAEKRRLELSEQKTRVVQAFKGLMLFSDEYIYKNFYGMNDREIDEVRKQKEEEAALLASPGTSPLDAQPGGQPGMPPEGGAPQPEAPPQ